MILVKQHIMSENGLLEITSDSPHYGKVNFPLSCKWLTAEVGGVSNNKAVTLIKFFNLISLPPRQL